MIELQNKYDELQYKYGSKNLNSVYGCGCSNSPKVALVFMNPTKRNIATDKNWKGLRAQWLGTKQIWDFLVKCNLFDREINERIKAMKPRDWSVSFCEEVYKVIENNCVWMTNLAKCSQDDARELSDDIFLQYKDLLLEELAKINPEKIFLFGNQVSSIVLNEKINVSQVRLKKYVLTIKGREYECYSLYYPVGNGRFNQDKTVEDIKTILKL